MSYEIDGTIIKVEDPRPAGRNFVAPFVIKTSGQYPEDVPFDRFAKPGENFQPLSPGIRVRVHFDVRGREWKGKHYPCLKAWKIEPIGAPAPPQNQMPQSGVGAPPGFDEGDPIPF